MTNFERFRDTLTQDEFIEIMCLNCEYCPIVDNCGVAEKVVASGADCEEVLRPWCEREVTE